MQDLAVHQNVWQQIKRSLTLKNADNKPLRLFFEPTSLVSVDNSPRGHRFCLGVPTELHKYWISQNLLNSISSEISAIYQSPFEVDLIVTGEASPSENMVHPMVPTSTTHGPTNPDPSDPVVMSTVNRNQARDFLNPEYTFSTFVVGRNNEFAHAACFSIAEKPGTENYNPLFIYGPTGMGKTHLLNAVGNNIRSRFPDLRICYISAERFLNECISAIRRREMDKFRLRYREHCDVLLMDDIQVLGKGDAVQEEFFHTLNDFFEKGQQVAVASDRMPKDIRGLEDRIRTRLEWGLIADIQMPDLETRVAILKYKCESRRIMVSHDVISYIARISKRSIRELEGNLNKVNMYSELQGLNLSLDLAKKVLANHDDAAHLSVDEIQKMVADHFKVRMVDLRSKSRTKPLVTARQLAMYLIKKHLDKSLVDIGRSFGGKDHTTVINALKRIPQQLLKDPDLKKDLDDLEQRIHNITGV